jgi:hypothetical protein
MRFYKIALLPALALGLALTSSQVAAQLVDKPGNPRKPDGTLRKPGDNAGTFQDGECIGNYIWTNGTLKGVEKPGYRRRLKIPCLDGGPAGIVE